MYLVNWLNFFNCGAYGTEKVVEYKAFDNYPDFYIFTHSANTDWHAEGAKYCD